MAAATVVEADAATSEGAAAFSGVQGRGWEDCQLRPYPFPSKPIPRLSHTDPRAEMLINNEVNSAAEFACWNFLKVHFQFLTNKPGLQVK